MRELLRKFQMIVSLALGSVPAAVLVFYLLTPELLSWAWAYPVAYGVCCILCAWIPPKARLLFGTILSAASVFMSVFFAGSHGWIPVLLADMCYAVLFLWSLTIYSWPPERELPDLLRLICVGIHLICQFTVYMDRAESRFLLTAQAPGIHATFLGFLILLLFSMNRSSIYKASSKSRRVPEGMRRKNTWMTAVLVVLACGASFIPYIYDWLKTAILWIVKMLSKLLRSSPSEPQRTPDVSPSESAGEGLQLVEKTSLLAEIIEKVVVVLGILVIIGLCLVAIVLLLRRLKKWLGNVWTRLEQYAAAVAEDYEDEITDIRKETLGERIERKRRIAVWKKEPVPIHPGENIRYRYRRLLRRHPQWTANTTARENIPQELAVLYEKARYSDHTISSIEAEAFRTKSEQLQ